MKGNITDKEKFLVQDLINNHQKSTGIRRILAVVFLSVIGIFSFVLFSIFFGFLVGIIFGLIFLFGFLSLIHQEDKELRNLFYRALLNGASDSELIKLSKMSATSNKKI